MTGTSLAPGDMAKTNKEAVPAPLGLMFLQERLKVRKLITMYPCHRGRDHPCS